MIQYIKMKLPNNDNNNKSNDNNTKNEERLNICVHEPQIHYGRRQLLLLKQKNMLKHLHIHGIFAVSLFHFHVMIYYIFLDEIPDG